MKIFYVILSFCLIITVSYGQEKKNDEKIFNEVLGGYSWLSNSDDSFVDLCFNMSYPILNYLYAFYEFDLGFGLKDNKNKYILNVVPGLSLYLLNKSNLYVKVDLSTGPSLLKYENVDFQMGITTMMRIGLGYKSFGIYSQINFYQFKTISFQKNSVGISFIF